MRWNMKKSHAPIVGRVGRQRLVQLSSRVQILEQEPNPILSDFRDSLAPDASSHLCSDSSTDRAHAWPTSQHWPGG